MCNLYTLAAREVRHLIQQAAPGRSVGILRRVPK
jgi:hypothetical protein